MCCFLGLLFFDWGPGYVRRGFFRPFAFQFLVDGVGGCWVRGTVPVHCSTTAKRSQQSSLTENCK